MGFSGLFNIPKNTPTALIPGTATARSSHLSQSNCIIAYRIIGTLVSEKTPLRTQPPKSCLRKMTSWSWTKHKPCIKCCGAIIDDVLHWEVTSCGPSLIMLVPRIIEGNMHAHQTWMFLNGIMCMPKRNLYKSSAIAWLEYTYSFPNVYPTLTLFLSCY